MANNVTTSEGPTNTIKTKGYVPPEIMQTVRLYHDRLTREGRKTFTPDPPTGRTLAILKRAAEDAHAALRAIDLAAAEKKSAAGAIAVLFVGRHMKEDPAQLVAAYVLQLKDMPLFAIQNALEDYKHGNDRAKKLECKPGWPPSPPQLWQLAEYHRNELARQHDMIADVIEAKHVALPAPKSAPVKTPGLALEKIGETLKRMPPPDEAERKKYLNDKAIADNARMVERDYKVSNIEPFFSKGGALVALPLARQMEQQGVLRLEPAGPGMKRFVIVPKSLPPGGDDAG